MIIKELNIQFDKEKTRKFYENYDQMCTCIYCKNFYKTINKTYPNIEVFLEQFGIIIEKPVEAMEFYWTEDKKRLYTAVYSVYGAIDCESIKIELERGVVIEIGKEDRLFDTGMQRPYIIIEVHNLRLNWELEESPDD